MSRPLLMGAVAYDPKVVTIWDGFRRWFADQGLDFDYVLYSHYERQVEDLVAGRIDAGWNSPLAWVRTRRMAPEARAVAMRDTDRDLTSVLVVRGGSTSSSPPTSRAAWSPRAPSTRRRARCCPSGWWAGVEVTVRRFEVGVGLHGDHMGGERDAARALAAGRVDAACMLDGNHLLFTQDGTLPAGDHACGRPDPALRPLQHVGRGRPPAARALRGRSSWPWTTPTLSPDH